MHHLHRHALWLLPAHRAPQPQEAVRPHRILFVPALARRLVDHAWTMLTQLASDLRLSGAVQFVGPEPEPDGNSPRGGAP